MATYRFLVEIDGFKAGFTDYARASDERSALLRSFGQYKHVPGISITRLDADSMAAHGTDRMAVREPDSVGHPVAEPTKLDSAGTVAVGKSEERSPYPGFDLDAIATREYFPPLCDAPIHHPRELSDCD